VKLNPSVGQSEAGRMPSRGYLLCGIERTGSNLLAEALSRMGVAGCPIEYFNPVMQDKKPIRDILGDSEVVGGLDKVLMAGTTPNGVFGAKVFWPHLRFLGMQMKGEWSESERVRMQELMRSHRPNLLSLAAANELLHASFSDLRAQTDAYALLRSHVADLRFVWLKRKNMAARAISMYRARKTDVWFRSVYAPEAPPGEKTHDFDLAEIHDLYCIGAFQEQNWQQFFEEQNISPYCVVYEELVADYDATVHRVLEFLEIGDAGAVIPGPTSVKQSDAQSLEWEDRYRKSIPEADI
jgi:trehalose 2-sulfotransferase